MKFSLRLLRSWQCAAASLLLLSALAPAAFAQDAGVVRIVVPAPPGGNLDTTARAIAQRLTAITGETHLVENRPGANTVIGTEHVVRASADGRTMLFTGSSLVLNAWLQKLSFSPDELRPVVQVSQGHFVLVVSPTSGLDTVQELEAQAAKRPQGLNCAAPPGPMAMACEQFKSRWNGKVTTIPYAGIGPALTALAGGHVDFTVVYVEAADSLLQAGRLRALAASSATASSQVPLFSQVWPGFVLEGFNGLLVPARTPADKVRQINRSVNQVLSEGQMRAQMHETGQEPVGGAPEVFAQSLDNANKRYGELVRKLNLGPK